VVRFPQTTVDPARDSASLLRRIGFLVLLIGLPLGALASRNGTVLVFVIGVALIALAAVFDRASRRLRESFGRLASSPALVAIAVLAGWALLSLAWTPILRTGVFAAIGIPVLAVIAFLSLPERMRAANLYLVPVGVVIGAATITVLSLAGSTAADPEMNRRIERGLSVLVLLIWPAVAWLRSRGRDVEALAIAGLTLIAAWAGTPGTSAVDALAFGAIAYSISHLFGRRGASATGLALAVLVVAAPALLVWGVPLASRIAGFAGWSAVMEAWREAVFQDPYRLLTGRGVGALRSAEGNLRELRAFGAPVLGLWYEVGAVGALAVATALASGLTGATAGFGPLLPALAGATATAFCLALFGIDGGETWWLAVVSVVVLAFVAAERGQFRTRRPRALGNRGVRSV